MTNDIHVTDGSVLETLNNKVDLDGGNYPSSGLERYIDKTLNTRYDLKYLNRTQITNCLLEVPQNIKLELNNGVLTLKAGSQVIVPNGFEADGVTKKFDYVTVERDVLFDFSGWGTIKRTLTFNTVQQKLEGFERDTQTSSGSTVPAVNYVYMTWYDTANNLVKYSSDSGTTWSAGGSLPLAIFSGGDSVLDQVFNGMGYIGSTVWIDKGVKVLIANGRNDNGTLNNIEAITDKVVTKTVASATNAPNHYIMIGADGGIYGPTTIEAQYNETLNVNTYQDNIRPWTIVGYIDITKGVMSNLVVKQPFRAVDYNEVTSLCVPDYSAEITIGTPTTTEQSYTAPTDGLIVLSLYASSDGRCYVLINNTTMFDAYGSSTVDTANTVSFYVLKGDVIKYITCINNLSPTAKFFPLKGAK